jgi:hypothetical protein
MLGLVLLKGAGGGFEMVAKGVDCGVRCCGRGLIEAAIAWNRGGGKIEI